MDAPSTSVSFPRISIQYCTQCRWMLRAAYYAQELLTTFNTSIGEIALVPATGGKFVVELEYLPSPPTAVDGGLQAGEGQQEQARKVLIWDRKEEGGFPETKVLKQKLRDYIEPEKNLGHSDKEVEGS